MMQSSNNFIVLSSTVAMAILLTLLPMPQWFIWMRPAWVLMVLLYWTIALPRVNLGLAWVMGMVLDVLTGTLLGEHAFALVLVVYIASRMQARLKMFLLLQQALCIFLLTLLYQFILFCIQGFLGELPGTWLYWLSSVTTMLLWPWISIILNDSRKRFRVV